jgi:hypothetical protein
MADTNQLDVAASQDTGSDTQDTATATKPGDPLDGDSDSQKLLYDLYIKCVAEDRYPRLIEVKDVKQAENYWAGRQYEWWSKSSKSWQLPSAAQTGYGDLDLDDMPRFQFVTNIYQARGLMVIGAVAGAPPRVRFFPADADSAADLETADGRTKLARLIQRWNPVQKMLQEEVYHAWTGGFITYWARYVGDGEKFGVDSLDILSEGSEDTGDTLLCPQCGWAAPADTAEPPVPCPDCGNELTVDDIVPGEPIPMPEDGGTVDAPKGREVISVFGALNCKRPQHVQDQSEFHYFAIEREVHYSTLRAAFDEKADEIKPGLAFGADDSFERNARLSVAENTKLLTQSGNAQANLCTYAVVWFRPSAFWMIDDKGKRAKLLEKFPRGCRVELCGSTYLKSEAQSMDDCIVTTHVMPGRGQHRNAIGTSMLSIQDRVNTFSNIEAETYEYGIPITYRASDTFASEADEDQRAAPGLEVEIALQPGQQIQNRIMQVRADTASPTMQAHEQQLMGPVSDEISGAYPALSGAQGESTPDTLGQQAMQRDQAMGRMGVFYVNLKQAHADILTLACRDLEQNIDGIVKSPVLGDSGDFESDSIDITAMEGEAEAYPEGDENFPELWNQQRATMMQIMDSPYGAKLVEEPETAELFTKLTGIPELKMPGSDSRRKQLKEIGEIIKALTPTEESPMGGTPMVEVDPDVDNNEVEAATCKSFLNSAKGVTLKQQNPMAWLAIKQHMMQHVQAIPKPPEPEKPLSESFTLTGKDIPPEAIAQILAKYGITVGPQDFINKAMLDKASKPTPKPPLPPGSAPAPKGAPNV